jgi:integrase/recombinase XerD
MLQNSHFDTLPTPARLEQPLLPLVVRAPAPTQADSDAHLISLWLAGRPPTTRDTYQRSLRRFRLFVGERPLREVRLGDLHDYLESLADRAPATRARLVAVVKSLFTFGSKLGYFPFNTAAPVIAPKVKDTLAERILSEVEVLGLLAADRDPRNHALLRLLYGSGARVSEICALHWRDCQAVGEAGQITVFGKGGKTRAILLSAGTWAEMSTLRLLFAQPDDPVFRSQKGGRLSRVQVLRIVRAAAQRAGLTKPVSPHWLRHAHASHNLDRNTPLHLVQQTLGHSSIAITGRYLHARPQDSSARHLAV